MTFDFKIYNTRTTNIILIFKIYLNDHAIMNNIYLIKSFHYRIYNSILYMLFNIHFIPNYNQAIIKKFTLKLN